MVINATATASKCNLCNGSGEVCKGCGVTPCMQGCMVERKTICDGCEGTGVRAS